MDTTGPTPTSDLDTRFSDPSAQPLPWDETERLLREAGLYWLSTIRSDGRPHVTPVVGVWLDGAFHFCTGAGEQKWRNLAEHPAVAVTTGSNSWDAGVDVVVEGSAERVTDAAGLTLIAEAFLEKYGEAWQFEVTEDGFVGQGGAAPVLRVPPVQVLAFAKAPHGQTRHRFAQQTA